MIKNIKGFVVVASIIEILLLTCGRNFFGIFVSPIVLLLNGLGISIYALWYAKRAETLPTNIEKRGKWQLPVLISMAIMGGITIVNLVKAVLRVVPIDVKASDVIPLLQKMVAHFLEGKPVYKSFNDFGYDIYPTYLPTQWIPFIFAEYWKTDYRMTATIVLLLALAFFFYKIIQSNLTFLQKLLLIIVSCGFVDVFLAVDGYTIAVSVEQMIMGYYIFLAVVLATSKNPILRGIAISLCLLSRFSFLFWLPMYVFSVYMLEGYKPTLKMVSTIAIIGMVLYVPFLIQEPNTFFNAQITYENAALGEWSRADTPPHLGNGMGLATHFYHFLNASIPIKIKAVQLTNVILSMGVSIWLSFFLFKNKHQLNIPIFNVASLKILITLFYALIQVPYVYLFYVPLGITFVLIFVLFNSSAKRSEGG
ncbi:MAG: hypothetical protein RL329_3371 [Bacteroidota bacterium]|jgi:hypothetical protein